MSVPFYWCDSGLPIGMHFSAQLGEEVLLLRLAGQLEGGHARQQVVGVVLGGGCLRLRSLGWGLAEETHVPAYRDAPQRILSMPQPDSLALCRRCL